MKPAVRLSGALGLGAAVYLYGATSEVAWMFLLGYLIWGLSIAAFAYARWNHRGLGGRISVAGAAPGTQNPAGELPEALLRAASPPGPVFEGDSLRLELELTSRRGTRGPARLAGRVGDEDLLATTAVVPAGGWRKLHELAGVRRGPIRSGLFRLDSSDPLGLFQYRDRRPGAEVALVLPVFTSLSRRPRHRELESNLPAPRAGAGGELFGVREYQAGDSLRRIHWRASARHAQLVVREFEPPGLRALGIVLDPEPAGLAAADQSARIAASEAWDCIREGGRVSIWAPGLEGSLPAHSRDLWSLLEWLARYPDLPASGGPPPVTGELVAIATRPDSPALAELEPAVRRGLDARAWVIGEFDVASQRPVTRVGLAWPL